MNYCMSDIHGDLQRYRAMLSIINFSNSDNLYIIGDTIDRGPDGVDVLLDIMSRPNVQLILGNHEAMLLATLGPNNEIGAREQWERNGGDSTRADLLYCRRPETRKLIIEYLLTLPDHLNINIAGQPFHLVHGYPASDRFNRIWSRPSINLTQPPIPGTTVIIGHTPTIYLHDNPDNTNPIWHGPGIIGIDCGCGLPWLDGQLGCLRLEDFKEFYI